MVDHFAMKDAHIRALQQELSLLRSRNADLSISLDDSEILLDSVATSLKILLDNRSTSKDIEEAQYAYSLWLRRKEDNR